ncbi:hypothetical protein [Streptomyces sp. NPDC051219]|uniref:hypothetical protein n=1 Tax=Streptomyces sp. NPDC051219 TaxID=3155283 RepID=UPI00342489AF
MATDIVTVCLTPVDPEKVLESLTAALAPYDQNSDSDEGGFEWRGEWDWWHIFGGDGDKGLPVLPNFDCDPRLIRVPVYRNGDRRKRFPLRCDGGPRRLLDFDADRSSVAARASDTWENLWSLSRKSEKATSLRAFFDRCIESPQYSAQQARSEYLLQPFVRAVSDSGILGGLAVVQESQDPVSWLELGIEQFVRREVSRALPTGALVTVEGEWVDDSVDNSTAESPIEMVRRSNARNLEYMRFADEYLENLDGDVVVVRVLYHS